MFWESLGLMFLEYVLSVMLLFSLAGGIILLFELRDSEGWWAFGEGLLGLFLIALSLLLSYAMGVSS